MNRLAVVFTMIVLFGYQGIAQEKENKFSFDFNNSVQKSAIDEISKVTGYKIYYLSEWLSNDTINKSFNDISIDKALDFIFEDTNINYFFFEGDKIVLTKNTIIYEELPEDFFGKVDTLEQVETTAEIDPLFYEGFKTTSDKKIETFRIGKTNRNNLKKTYRLSGIVSNIDTKEPIPDLTIILEDGASGVVTKENGYFDVQLKSGLNILEFRALGIENVKKRVFMYNDGNLNIELAESFNQLEEVVLSGELNRNVEESLTGAEEIDVEESKNIPLVLGERDVLKVATSLPGISTAGEGSAGFNVRGGESDQNLILFDEAVIYNPQHFFGLFSALNPFAISQLDIFKGSIPAEYGGRVSSVFDIKTKNANANKFSGEASIGPVTSNLLLEVPVVKDKSSFMIGGRAAYANWILRSLNEESLNNSQASFYDVIANYNHKINDNNNVKVTAYYSKDDFSITSDSVYLYNNRLLSLKWDHKFNKKNTGSLILSNSAYDFNIEFDKGSEADFDLGYSVNETGLKLKMNYLHSPKQKFNYGIESKLYSVEPGSIDPIGGASIVNPLDIPTERGLESAAFISSNIDITDKLSLDAGVRYSFFAALGESEQRAFAEGAPRNEGTVIDTLSFDKNEVIETYGGPEFRISARYLLSNDFSLKASYNNTIQYIHRLSNNTTVSPIDTWKLSDLNIEPQRGRQYSLGLYKNFNTNTYEVSLEGFYKTTENTLDFKTGAQLLLNENIETEVLQGEGKSYGVEFLIRKNNGRLNGWLGYTYSRSLLSFDSQFSEERINNGDFFPSNFDKPHDISLVANYKFTKRFSLSTNFVYQTGRPVTVPVGNFNFNNSEFAVFSDRNSFRIPDFYRLDLGFNIEGNHKIKKLAHSFWTISIYNVLGRNNPFSVFFVTENGQVEALKASIFSVPVPAITYNFKF
ncbi:carboxypeptidase-like regulatory domain-containing protein [uncultured Croceitalea sp.]|uniref:TonB-dependent receptor n=1 Tax=uncultured Croceitalea sp. TaxID=1798908 RepID=UPI0033068016